MLSVIHSLSHVDQQGSEFLPMQLMNSQPLRPQRRNFSTLSQLWVPIVTAAMRCQSPASSLLQFLEALLSRTSKTSYKAYGGCHASSSQTHLFRRIDVVVRCCAAARLSDMLYASYDGLGAHYLRPSLTTYHDISIQFLFEGPPVEYPELTLPQKLMA